METERFRFFLFERATEGGRKKRIDRGRRRKRDRVRKNVSEKACRLCTNDTICVRDFLCGEYIIN